MPGINTTSKVAVAPCQVMAGGSITSLPENGTSYAQRFIRVAWCSRANALDVGVDFENLEREERRGLMPCPIRSSTRAPDFFSASRYLIAFLFESMTRQQVYGRRSGKVCEE